MVPEPELKDIIHSSQILWSFKLSAAVLTIYDHGCTFPEEVEFIWKRAPKPAKVLYSAVSYAARLVLHHIATNFIALHQLRYLGDCYLILQCIPLFVSSPSDKMFVHPVVSVIWAALNDFATSCKLVAQILIPIAFVIQVLCHIILVLRVRALYENSRFVTVLLGFVGGVLVSLMLYSVVDLEGKLSVNSGMIQGSYVCLVGSGSRNGPMYSASIVVFDIILVALVLKKFFTELSNMRSFRLARRISLIQLVIRDNIFYFLIASFTYLFIFLSWVIKPNLRLAISICFVPSVITLLGCRLMLNLLKSHSEDLQRGISVWSSHPLGTVH